MKAKKWIPKLLIGLFVVAFGVLCWKNGSPLNPVGTLWSLFPPVVAIGLALITKEVYSSLFVGIVMGGLLSAGFRGLGTVDNVMQEGFINAVAGQSGIMVFLVLLGILVALINKTGASAAFGAWAGKHIKSKAGVAFAAFFLGVLIFIDDYFNCLTVGAVMRPVSDQNKMSRAKLAYIIDATAAPVCMIAPISSWAAAVASYAPEGTSGISLFCRAIPYNFYSLLTFVFIISITLMKFDYGAMRIHEANAMRGDLFTSGEATETAEETTTGKGKVRDLIIPVLVLIAVCVFALVYQGGILDGAGFIQAFSDTDATVGLPWGGIIVLLFTIIYYVARRLISFKEAMECVPKGFVAMVPAMLILTMATSLKNMTGLLDSGTFVQGALSSVSGLEKFLPAIIFVVACAISFATGTSWGTFGILIPIVTVIFPVDNILGVVSMSACLAGSVCGDHCSPISDTSIMSSAGAQCPHLNHISTQLPYAMTVAVVSFITYVLSGFTQKIWIVLPVGALLTVGTLFALKIIVQRKEQA